MRICSDCLAMALSMRSVRSPNRSSCSKWPCMASSRSIVQQRGFPAPPSARMCLTATPRAWSACATSKATVTLQRFFFRTHERDAVTGHVLHNTLNSSLERSGFVYAVVADAPVFVTRRIAWAPAQLLSEECVFDFACGEAVRQRFAIELRIEAAVWGRTDIRHFRYAVALQQCDERLDTVRGMADGKNGRVHYLHVSTCILRFELSDLRK